MSKAVGRPFGTGGKAREISPQEIRIIDQCLINTRWEHRNRCLFHLCLGGGFRISEASGLRIKDVRPNGKILSEIVLEKHSCKSGKSRTVFLTKQSQDHLKKYLDNRGEVSGSDPLFPTQKSPNRPMLANVATQIIGRIFKLAGVAGSSHSMRRTHANSLRRNGADIKIIKEQLGHSSLAITDRYFEVDPIEAKKAIEKLKF